MVIVLNNTVTVSLGADGRWLAEVHGVDRFEAATKRANLQYWADLPDGTRYSSWLQNKIAHQLYPLGFKLAADASLITFTSEADRAGYMLSCWVVPIAGATVTGRLWDGKAAVPFSKVLVPLLRPKRSRIYDERRAGTARHNALAPAAPRIASRFISGLKSRARYVMSVLFEEKHPQTIFP